MTTVKNTTDEDKVFLLSRRWTHHAGHSGYDILGRYLGQTLSARPIPDRLLPDRVFWPMMQNMLGYDRTAAALELVTARHMATHRNCLYHALYGESSYNHLGQLNGWRGHRIIASYHHPPHKFAELMRKPEELKRLSAVVLLGQTQSPCFENILPPERIFFVPYAVDTTFFTPPADFSEREDNLCVFVGNHLRDFATLCAVIEDARILAPHLKFAVVAHKDDLAHFSGVIGNLTIYTNITEPELLKLYQKATLLIQPLQDAVANTALLEGMACGLPTVVSDVGAVREYVNEDFAYFVPPYHAKALLDAIIELVGDPQRRQRMASNARAQGLRFAWPIIAQRMRQVYEQVLSFG